MRERFLSAARALAVLGVFFLLSLPAIGHFGRLGFHYEDLSIPFDGGYRVLLGERPCADFVAPIGPVLFLQQALFFRLFGVGLDAYLLHAAVLNALAGWAVWLLLRRRHPGVALAAGAVTLGWFYLPPSAPYIDTTAFFWTLLALLALGDRERERGGGWRAALAGLGAGMAFLVKQNVGGLAIAGLAALLGLRERRLRPVAVFLAAAAVPLVLLAGYAALAGGWEGFRHYFFAVPLGSGRLKYLLPWGARMAVKLLHPELVNSSFAELAGPAIRELLVYAGCAALAVAGWRTGRPERRGLCATAVFLLLLQQWSFNTSNNNEALYWPFAGLLLGLVALLRPVRTPVFAAAALALLLFGIRLGAARTVHDLRVGGLSYTVEHPRLAGLRMPAIAGRSLDAVLRFLDREIPAADRVAVLGEATLLHGAAGRPPSQPLLWFRAGVSYSADDPAVTEERIEAALTSNRVGWIVVDDSGARQLAEQLPALARWLDEHFAPVDAGITGFRIYRRRPSPRG